MWLCCENSNSPCLQSETFLSLRLTLHLCSVAVALLWIPVSLLRPSVSLLRPSVSLLRPSVALLWWTVPGLRTSISLLLPVAVVARLRWLSVLVEARMSEARLSVAAGRARCVAAGCVGSLVSDEGLHLQVEGLLGVRVLTVHQLAVHLLCLPVQTAAGRRAHDARHDEEAVAPRDDVEVRPRHPRPVLAQEAEHHGRDEDGHCCRTEARRQQQVSVNEICV